MIELHFHHGLLEVLGGFPRDFMTLFPKLSNFVFSLATGGAWQV
jgi:hypothetical protein